MKYLRYGFLFFLKHKYTYLLMLLQLILLFAAEIILISNLNSRDVLYAPYEEILANDGYYYSYPFNDGFWDNEGNFLESGYQMYNDLAGKLKGDVDSYFYFRTSAKVGNSDAEVIIIDDEIYEKLLLPLSSGTRKSGGDACIVTKNKIGLKKGSTLSVDGKKITVTGVLTDNTYIPDYSVFDVDMGLTDLYMPFTYSGTKASTPDFLSDDITAEDVAASFADATYAIVPFSSLGGIEEAADSGDYFGCVIISYNSTPSAAEKEYNEQLLVTPPIPDKFAGVEIEETDGDSRSGAFIPLAQIKEKALLYLNEDFNKLFPLVVCLVVVIFAGIICSSAIVTARQMRKFALIYLNGATVFDCVIISCLTAVTTCAAALVITLPIILFGFVNSLANNLGFVWGINNVLAIVATVLFSAATFAIIPAITLRRKKNLLFRETN